MRAIILAAGMGTRLRPLTIKTPKSLIKVKDKPLIERQIEYLKEKGIDEIIVVTGYLKESFEYLKEKYNVELFYNDKYDIYNNIYTMNLVKDYLGDSYVIDADIYLDRNIFKNDIKDSTYFSVCKAKFNNEWKIVFDENNNIEKIDIVEEGFGYILSGVSYWSVEDSKVIKEELERIMKTSDFSKFYWDDIVRLNIGKLNVKIDKLKEDDIFEIDSLEDLEEINNKVKITK